MRALLLGLYIFVLLLGVNAVTKNWAGVTGATDQNWSTSSNWSPAGVPAAGDDVVINQVQDATLGYDVVALPSTAVSCNSLTMSSSSRMQITSSTPSLNVAGQMTVAGQVFLENIAVLPILCTHSSYEIDNLGWSNVKCAKPNHHWDAYRHW